MMFYLHIKKIFSTFVEVCSTPTEHQERYMGIE